MESGQFLVEAIQPRLQCMLALIIDAGLTGCQQSFTKQARILHALCWNPGLDTGYADRRSRSLSQFLQANAKIVPLLRHEHFL